MDQSILLVRGRRSRSANLLSTAVCRFYPAVRGGGIERPRPVHRRVAGDRFSMRRMGVDTDPVCAASGGTGRLDGVHSFDLRKNETCTADHAVFICAGCDRGSCHVSGYVGVEKML